MTDVSVQQEVSQESLVAQAADEFLERRKQGQEPTIEEYTARYPQAAALIRKALAALQVIDLSRVVGSPGASGGAPAVVGGCLGDFRILGEIGRGGMGIVYEAVQLSLDRRVALKVLPVDASRDAKLLARFRREALAAAQLHHTNIVPVFEVGQQGDVFFYAMQYIEGQPLDQVIRELQQLRAVSGATTRPKPARAASAVARSSLSGQFEPARAVDATLDFRPAPDQPRRVGPEADTPIPGGLTAPSELSRAASDFRLHCRQVARLGLQVAEALAYAHGRGIIHRDIKPSNLLLDSAGSAWVSDFGLAKTEEQNLTETGEVVGTLRYMAPERFQSVCDARADVYALGLTLYELLVLRPAFDGQDRLHLVDQISRQEPARLRTLDPRIPRDLETLLMKAIEKDPRRRYPSAETLAGDLRRFLADETIQARRIGPLERLGRWGRRNPLVASLTAAIIVVAALGFVGVFGQMQQALAHEQEAQRNEREANKQRDDAQAANEQLRATQAQLRSTLYAAQINVVQHAWEKGGVLRMVELLEQHRPKTGETELRGWEWHYLYRLCHAELLTLKGHTGQVLSVVYSPDGKRLASAGNDRTTKVWDAQTGHELLSLDGLKGSGNSVAFSPDGKHLATVGSEVKVWDVQTGQELLSLKGGSDGVAYSPDGKRLASAGYDRTTKVWDAQTGQELLILKGGGYSVTFSPDGKRLAGVDDKTVKVWDAQTGQELLSLKGVGRRVAFSPDGKRLAGPSDERTVKVWDAQTGQELLSLKGARGGVAFSPDGKRLASPARDFVGAVKVWDAQTGQELLAFKHSGGVSSVAFSPDGKRLASAGSWDHTVKVWDAQKDPEKLTLQAVGARLAFSPDGRHLATGSDDHTVKVWDVVTGRQALTLKGHTFPVSSVAFSPDGKRLASGGGGSRYPGGQWGISSNGRAELKVWDTQTARELLTLQVSSGSVGGLAFSPDGNRLASAYWDGTVKVWDAQTGQELLSLKGARGDVAYSPDGKRLANGEKVWDAQTGQELLSLKGAYGGVAFSPDGKRLASGLREGALQIWDVQTGQEIRTLLGHAHAVLSVAFSPDGQRLASMSGDKTVKIWDAQTGQELVTFEGGGGLFGRVAFSPDGHRLAASMANGTVTIWDGTPLPAKL
jgi:WD40 repeat protein/serine/threonine protein kinase